MMSDRPKISVEAARSTMRAAGSRALAQALICGINEVVENGGTLTESDRIHLTTMAIMAYEEIITSCNTLDIEVSLQEFRDYGENN